MGVTIPGPSGEVLEQYEISNSLRFNDDDDARLTRSVSGNLSKAHTFALWIKRGNLKASGRHILAAMGDGSGDISWLELNNDRLAVIFDGAGNYFPKTDAVLRDPSAWYHIVVAVDSTESTAADRCKFYINGVQFTNTSGTFPPLNHQAAMDACTIGYNSGDEFDGYMAEFHFLDGVAYDPTYFGRFNENNVWVPKKYTGGNYGTNGFYFEFKQTGTSANSSGIGADTSGNDSHFTPTNLAAQDVTTDTCTNNFATLNFVDGSYDSNLSEGNLVLDTSAGGSDIFGRGTIGFSQGKWYWEVKSIISGGHGNRKIVGIVDPETPVAHPRGVTANPYTGVLVDLYDGDVFRNASGASDSGSYSTNDILGFLFDADNGLVYLQQNGSNLFSGNAVTTNAIDTTLTYLPYIAQDGGGTNNGKLYINFGNPPAVFSISSGNSDANGHGNFEYAVPSGYFSICTKNLAEFG